MKNLLTKKVFEEAEQKLKDLLFPVELCEVNVRLPDKNMIYAKTFKGVVRTDTNHIFSVVSDDYKLITNEEAINLGKKIFKLLFNELNKDEIKPYRVFHSNSYGLCSIQLVHESVNFMVFEQDEWLPFIQVSNSYNKAVSLKFDLGFVRKLCSNGMIFQKDTVEIKINHSKKEKFDLKMAKGIRNFENISGTFSSHIQKLKNISFDRSYLVPLTCKIFNLDFALEPNWIKNSTLDIYEINKKIEKDRKEFQKLNHLINMLSDEYFSSLGDNMYAALNVFTDLVSNHADEVKKFKQFAQRSDFYFYSPTKWMIEMNEKKFNNNHIGDYLGEYLKYHNYN